MGQTITQLPAVTTLDDADVFEVEQAGVSKKITKLQLVNLVFTNVPDALVLDKTILPQPGDVVSYNGAVFSAGATPRWRVVSKAAYTEAAVTTSSTITFVGTAVPPAGIQLRASDYFRVGMPVRVVIGVNTYYGICHDVSATTLTISGAILPTGTAIDSLSVGTSDMVKHVEMRFFGTGYNSSATLVLTKGCQHQWHGATGYLVRYSCAHMNTSSTTAIKLQMNGGANVSTAGVIPAAGTTTTYGAFVDSALGSLIQGNVEIAHNQLITAKTQPVGGAGADYLIVCMTFVVP